MGSGQSLSTLEFALVRHLPCPTDALSSYSPGDRGCWGSGKECTFILWLPNPETWMRLEQWSAQDDKGNTHLLPEDKDLTLAQEHSGRLLNRETYTHIPLTQEMDNS